ncbi:MAG: HAD family phosphatase [Clostridiales bacterium]|nr:HAD family phosphatase [Clostridiales bacterium]
MNIPKLIIFDMDGLIFDSERLFMQFLSQIMLDYGYHLTREQYCQTLGLSMNDVRTTMKEFFGEDYPCDEISAMARRRMNEYAFHHPLPVKPGIEALLRHLQLQGIACCVASSSPRETVSLYLETARLSSYFSFIIGGDDLLHSKPDPEIFLTCCRHFQTAPADAVVLEDSENGIKAALAGNIPVICIPDMKRPGEELLSRTLCTLDTADQAAEILICHS